MHCLAYFPLAVSPSKWSRVRIKTTCDKICLYTRFLLQALCSWSSPVLGEFVLLTCLFILSLALPCLSGTLHQNFSITGCVKLRREGKKEVLNRWPPHPTPYIRSEKVNFSQFYWPTKFRKFRGLGPPPTPLWSFFLKVFYAFSHEIFDCFVFTAWHVLLCLVWDLMEESGVDKY